VQIILSKNFIKIFLFFKFLSAFEVHIFAALDIHSISQVAIFLFCCNLKTNNSIISDDISDRLRSECTVGTCNFD